MIGNELFCNLLQLKQSNWVTALHANFKVNYAPNKIGAFFFILFLFIKFQTISTNCYQTHEFPQIDLKPQLIPQPKIQNSKNSQILIRTELNKNTHQPINRIWLKHKKPISGNPQKIPKLAIKMSNQKAEIRETQMKKLNLFDGESEASGNHCSNKEDEKSDPESGTPRERHENPSTPRPALLVVVVVVRDSLLQRQASPQSSKVCQIFLIWIYLGFLVATEKTKKLHSGWFLLIKKSIINNYPNQYELSSNNNNENHQASASLLVSLSLSVFASKTEFYFFLMS